MEAVASGIQLAVFAATLLGIAERLTEDVRGVREFLKHLTEKLRCLDDVLKSLDNIIDDPDILFESDRHHLDSIKRMKTNCLGVVVKLHDKLPKLDEDAGKLQTLWAGFAKNVKYRTIREYEADIQSYIGALQLSLHFITFRKLTLTQGQNQVYTDNDEERTVVQDIDEWYSTFASTTRDTSSCGSENTPIGEHSLRERLSNPVSASSGSPSQSDLLRQASLDKKLGEVKSLEEKGRFLEAAVKQKEAIADRRRLDRFRPFELEEKADMKEYLADLQLKCSTVGLHKKALDFLMEIFNDAAYEHVSPDLQRRLGRLHYKIADLHLSRHKLGDIGQQSKGLEHVWDAFDDLSKVRPYPDPYLIKTAKLLAKASPDHEEEAVRNHLIQDSGTGHWSGQNVDLSWDDARDDAEPKALIWCKENGYDVRSPAFRFDTLSKKTSPFHSIVETNETDVLKQMLSEIRVQQIDLKDSLGRSPLQIAVAAGSLEAIRVLLGHDASTKVLDASGRCVLHLCQVVDDDAKSAATAEVLLDKDPSLLNLKDGSGNTALFLACERGHRRTARSLMRRGADANLTNNEGTTPLLAAVKNCCPSNEDRDRLQIIDILLRPCATNTSRADPNIRNNSYHSPLHSAVVNGHLEVVRMLKYFGASLDQTGQNGELPKDAAQRRGYTMIYNLLTGKAPRIPNRNATEVNSRRTSQASGSSQESGNRRSTHSWTIPIFHGRRPTSTDIR